MREPQELMNEDDVRSIGSGFGSSSFWPILIVWVSIPFLGALVLHAAGKRVEIPAVGDSLADFPVPLFMALWAVTVSFLAYFLTHRTHGKVALGIGMLLSLAWIAFSIRHLAF